MACRFTLAREKANCANTAFHFFDMPLGGKTRTRRVESLAAMAVSMADSE